MPTDVDAAEECDPWSHAPILTVSMLVAKHSLDYDLW